MRTLLLGTDFMYNSNGDLVPIEINTNVGNAQHIIEEYTETFNLDPIADIIDVNGFTKVIYLGGIILFLHKLRQLCEDKNLPLEHHTFVRDVFEDDAETLIIRSAYDYTAIVDEEYCKNKINFLELIKTQSFGSQFAYYDPIDGIVNNITNIPNNGNEPNFILKSVYPLYNKDKYPKLFKVENQEELDVVLNNVNEEYFLMEFHYNADKLYEDHIRVIRSYNLLLPPDLYSDSIGQYTTITSRKIDGNTEYNAETHEVEYTHRHKYLTNDSRIGEPKLLDTDKVKMADGTFKTALELEVGDMIRTISVPNEEDYSIRELIRQYEIDYENFSSLVEYSTNRVTQKLKIDKLVGVIKITFTDDSEWFDTVGSSYLMIRDGIVQFGILNLSDMEGTLNTGDVVILIDTSKEEMELILKEVKTIESDKIIFSGWMISVENERIFLTQNEKEESFAAIEKNFGCSSYSMNGCQQGECAKGEYCCCFFDCGTPTEFVDCSLDPTECPTCT